MPTNYPPAPGRTRYATTLVRATPKGYTREEWDADDFEQAERKGNQLMELHPEASVRIEDRARPGVSWVRTDAGQSRKPGSLPNYRWIRIA